MLSHHDWEIHWDHVKCQYLDNSWVSQHWGALAVGLVQTFCHQWIISSDLLFCSCRWSHVELHDDDTKILVTVLLPLPKLKKFEYVPICGRFFMLYGLLSPVRLTLMLSESLFLEYGHELCDLCCAMSSLWTQQLCVACVVSGCRAIICMFQGFPLFLLANESGLRWRPWLLFTLYVILYCPTM